jgi:hypothetical protein
VLGAAICVAVLAIAVDGLFAALQRRVTPRALRSSIDYAAVQTEAAQAVPRPAVTVP